MPPKKVTHWTLKLHWGCCSACCCCCSKSRPPSLRAPKLSAAEGIMMRMVMMAYLFPMHCIQLISEGSSNEVHHSQCELSLMFFTLTKIIINSWKMETIKMDHMGRERVFSEKKILHHFRQAFWYRKGVRYHQKKFQNRDIGGFWENARFVRSNGRKTTFEWPKVVSEVSFPRFWGYFLLQSVFVFSFRWSEVLFLRYRDSRNFT